RTMLDMIASLPLMTAHRGKWAARPVGGTKQTPACPPEPSGSLPCRAGGGEQTDHGSAGHSGTTGDGTHQPGDRDHPPGRDGATTRRATATRRQAPSTMTRRAGFTLPPFPHPSTALISSIPKIAEIAREKSAPVVKRSTGEATRPRAP